MPRLASALASSRAPFVLLALAGALGASILSHGLVLDDLLLEAQLAEGGIAGLYHFVPADPVEIAARRHAGAMPWWTSDALQVEFWRPLSALAWALDAALWPARPLLRQLHSLVWYLVAVALVYACYRSATGEDRAGESGPGPWTSGAVVGLATLIWVVDDAHATSLSWLAARHALIGLSLGLAALLAHLRWREQGWSPGAVLGPLGLGLALLASESALAVVAYVAAHAWIREQGARDRLRVVGPWLLVAGAWAALYLARGQGVAACGMYLDFTRAPLDALIQLPGRAALAVLAGFGPPMIVELLGFASAATHRSASLVALALVVGLVWLLAPVWRRSATVRVWGLGTLLAALVAGLALPSERQLLWVGVGMAAVLAELIAALFTRKLEARGLRALAWVGVALQLVLAPLLFGLRAGGYATVQTEIERAADAMVEHRPGSEPIVLVHAPSELVAMYAPVSVRIEPALGLHLLYAGAGRVTLTRLDSDTLELEARWLDAPAERSYRGPSAPMAVGERVELDGLVIEVLAVDEAGRPTTIHASAGARPLDELGWMIWQDHQPQAWTLPALGEPVVLEPATWSFGG